MDNIITIGMDLGDRDHVVVVMDEKGKETCSCGFSMEACRFTASISCC